nr:hypothetical protein [Tanacetum cinerariifolium]
MFIGGLFVEYQDFCSRQDESRRDHGWFNNVSLLYRGEYSQWRERFMNYLEEQTDGEAMINFIQNGDQPLPVIAQVSLAGTAQNAPPTLKDLKFWTAEEKKIQKIDRLARSLLIKGLSNDIYSLIDSNKTAKDLWDALERQMRGSEYAEQYRKAAILYEYKTFKATEGKQLLDTYLCYLQVINDLEKCGYKKENCELNYKFLNNLQPKWKQYGTLMRQTKNLMNINIDALYNILKQNQGDVNDALGYKKKAVVVTSDPLALVAEKTKVSKRKEKVVVSLVSEGSGADDFSELKKITALLAKAFNRRKFYSKPTNNNLRTSSTSQSANKKQDFVNSDDKKLKAKWDIGVFVGYSKESVAFKIYNKRTRESSSSSLNDDVQQSPEEVILPQTNTQSISNNMVPNVDEASTSHNVFNERLEDTYFDASTSFHDPSNVHTFYQPYPHEKKWTKDHPFHKIIGDPKSSVRTRGQLENSCLFSCLLSSIEPANVAEALRDADWVSEMQEKLD